MINNVEVVLSHFYNRNISTREQLLTEVLRVKTLVQAFESIDIASWTEEKLFEQMKKNTESKFGYFPGDRDFFAETYELCKNIDIVEFAIEIYRNDRMGTIISSPLFVDYISELLKGRNAENVLITEAEKHISGLREILNGNLDKQFTLTTASPLMYNLLTLAFEEYQNVVKIIHQSIYTDIITEDRFEFIFCLPAFAAKLDEINQKFIASQTDGVAIETTLKLLSSTGALFVVVPVRLTFASGEFSLLRKYINENYSIENITILPEGTFRPYTAVKTNIIGISNLPVNEVSVNKLDVVNDGFENVETYKISQSEFSSHEDWRVELLISANDGVIKRFKDSRINKVKLKEFAEIFRGKSILKKDVQPGKIAVLNISNIEDGEIDYSGMELINDDERKVKRYELQDGDLVLTCRGTAIKTGVFRKQNNMVIASANVIVIRPSEKMLPEYLRIFFESPVGTAMVKSFQRGGAVMNINHNDIAEMDIPLVGVGEQQQLVEEYISELELYKEKIKQAETKWTETKDKIYNSIY